MLVDCSAWEGAIMSRKMTTAEARATAAARKTHGAGSGRPRKFPRCPCGKFTARRARKRRHVCQGAV